MPSAEKTIEYKGYKVTGKRRGKLGEYHASVERFGGQLYATGRYRGTGAMAKAIERAKKWIDTDAKNEIRFSRLKRLEFANSINLPRRINARHGDTIITKEWVGIGWIELEEYDESAPLVVGDKEE